MLPAAKGALAGVVAFAVTSVMTIAVTAAMTGVEPAQRLVPLQPAVATEPPASTLVGTARRELTFSTGGSEEGVDTDALLVTPEAGADVGVVLVAGSGASRREDLLAVAEGFAAQGVAALTYDKRNDGYTLLHRDYRRLADDALAARAMRETTGITRVGAWGISEGGWVLSEAASRPNTPLEFIVLASAPVVSPAEEAAWVLERRLRDGPTFVRSIATSFVGQGRFLMNYVDFDSGPLLAVTAIPVMAIWGTEDVLVPVNEAYRRLAAGLRGEVVARVFPRVGHNMAAVPEDWLPAVAAWVKNPAGSGLSGVEPTSDLGVAPIPPRRWFADPRLHVSISLVIAVATAIAVRRRDIRRARRPRHATISEGTAG